MINKGVALLVTLFITMPFSVSAQEVYNHNKVQQETVEKSITDTVINKGKLKDDVVFEKNIGTTESISSLKLEESDRTRSIFGPVKLNNNKLFVLLTDVPYLYDIKNDKWEKIQSKRIFNEYPTGLLKLENGNILIIGNDIHYSTVNGERGNFLKIELYNPSTNQFSSFDYLNTISGPYSSMQKYSVELYELDNGNIVLSGTYHIAGVKSNDFVFEYDMNEKKWLKRKKSILEELRYKYSDKASNYFLGDNYTGENGGHCRLMDGKLFHAGGSSRTSIYKEAEIFDVANDNWKLVSSMKRARSHTDAFLLNDSRIFVVGGLDKNYEFINTTEIYNPTEDEWTNGIKLKNNYEITKSVQLDNGDIIVVGLNKENKNELIGEKISINSNIKSVSRAEFSTMDEAVVFKTDSSYVVINGERYLIDDNKIKVKKDKENIRIPSVFASKYLKISNVKEDYISLEKLAKMMNKKLKIINDLIIFSDKNIYTEKNTVDTYLTMLDPDYKLGFFKDEEIISEKVILEKDGWKYKEYKIVDNPYLDDSYIFFLCRLNEKEDIFEYLFTASQFGYLKEKDNKIYMLKNSTLCEYDIDKKVSREIYYSNIEKLNKYNPYTSKFQKGSEEDRKLFYDYDEEKQYFNHLKDEPIKILNKYMVEGDYVYTTLAANESDYYYGTVWTAVLIRFKYDGSEANLLCNKKVGHSIGFNVFYWTLYGDYVLYNSSIPGHEEDYANQNNYELHRVKKDGSDKDGIIIANVEEFFKSHGDKLYLKNVDDPILDDPIIVSPEFNRQYKWYVSDIDGNKELFIDGTYTPQHFDDDYVLLNKVKMDYNADLLDEVNGDKTETYYYVYNLKDESVKKLNLDVKNRCVNIINYGKDYIEYNTLKRRRNPDTDVVEVITTGKYRINVFTGKKEKLN